MDPFDQPTLTNLALDLLEAADDARIDRASRSLLLMIDGKRNGVQLESAARALGLRDGVLEALRAAGLIELDRRVSSVVSR